MGAPGTTPGPYRFRQIDNDGLGYIEADERDIMHAGVADLSKAENIANAHQFAAAPDLYDALIQCSKQFDYYRQQLLSKNTSEASAHAIINGEFAAMCDAALAKARGETA